MRGRNVAWTAGTALLLFIAIDILLGSILLILGVTVSAWLAPVAAVLAGGSVWLLGRGAPARERALSLALAMALLALCVAVSSAVVDMSYDGNSYQKVAMGALANGWNPVWESIDDYFARAPLSLSPSTHALWADHYPKATWIFGASLYVLTGTIESGKTMNLVMGLILVLMLYRYLSERFLGRGWAAVVSILAAVNPITLPQFLTNYVDGLLCCTLLLIILLLVARADRGFTDGRGAAADILMAAAIVIAANIKFTGLVYAGFFCGSFWILELARSLRQNGSAGLRKAFLHRTGFYLWAVAIAVIVAGSNSYVRNAIDHGSPFYPLIGAQTVDIIKGYQPDSFEGMNPYEQFALSILSRTENLWKEEVDLKAPFTFEPQELVVSAVDTRRAGFGAFSSGIFFISGAICLVGCLSLRKRGRQWLSVALAIVAPSVALIGLTDGSWWARYTPYLWAVPIIALVMLTGNWKDMGRGRPRRILACALSLLVVADVATFTPAVGYSLSCTQEAATLEEHLAAHSGEIEVSLSDHALGGILYNLHDAGVDFRYVVRIPDDEVTATLDFVGLRIAEQ